MRSKGDPAAVLLDPRPPGLPKQAPERRRWNLAPPPTGLFRNERQSVHPSGLKNGTAGNSTRIRSSPSSPLNDSLAPETRETVQSKFGFDQVAERVGDVRPTLIGLVDVAAEVAGD